MAVTFQQLQDEVLGFTLKSNQSLSRFSYPQGFEERCETYLNHSPPVKDYPRFLTLNFDGFIAYNYHKWPEGKLLGEKQVEECMGHATVDDIKNWKTAIKCLQRYCLNLLLAPRRQDFYHIKVNFHCYVQGNVFSHAY